MTDSERYEAARAYIDSALRAVATASYSGIDAYAASKKVEPFLGPSDRIAGKWARATTAKERAAIAEEAEGLANNVKENLPGAPGNWTRTNLYPGEPETMQPATSYAGAVKDEALARVHDVATFSAGVWKGAGGLAKLALVGGAVFVGYRLLHVESKRNARDRR